MRKLFSFMVVTLDGYYEGPDGEFDWPNVDDEFNDFAISQLNDIDTLIFGRATYEGMASYWPTPAALEGDPVVADRMNSIPKVVFSSSLDAAEWQNTRLAKGKASEAVAELKAQDGGNILKFGTGELDRTLLEQGLVDEFQFWLIPIVVGRGERLFEGFETTLELLETTRFKSGVVALKYAPK